MWLREQRGVPIIDSICKSLSQMSVRRGFRTTICGGKVGKVNCPTQLYVRGPIGLPVTIIENVIWINGTLGYNGQLWRWSGWIARCVWPVVCLILEWRAHSAPSPPPHSNSDKLNSNKTRHAPKCHCGIRNDRRKNWKNLWDSWMPLSLHCCCCWHSICIFFFGVFPKTDSNLSRATLVEASHQESDPFGPGDQSFEKRGTTSFLSSTTFLDKQSDLF